MHLCVSSEAIYFTGYKRGYELLREESREISPPWASPGTQGYVVEGVEGVNEHSATGPIRDTREKTNLITRVG